MFRRLTQFLVAMFFGIAFHFNALAQSSAQNYKIGPYPIEFEMDGVKSIAWAHLFFVPVVTDRTLDEVRLRLTLTLQLDGVLKVADELVRRRSDSCARYNVDNWTYSLTKKSLRPVSSSTLRLSIEGNLTSWGCAPNPIPETVLETCDNGYFQYPCAGFRPGSDLKTQILYQTFDLSKDIILDIHNEKLRVRHTKEVITLGDTNPLSGLADIAVLFTNTLPFLLESLFDGPKPLFATAIPTGFSQLNPRFDAAGFMETNGAPFAVVQASVGITRNQVNSFMKSSFGNLWVDIPGLPPQPQKMTKTLMRLECSKYAPSEKIEDCVAKMGWPNGTYESLPN
jgi:hypothetical protein